MGGWTKVYTSSSSFSFNDIPNLHGKVAIVTGSNTGIGYITALELAKNGATVIVAARNIQRGQDAASKIQQELLLSNKSINDSHEDDVDESCDATTTTTIKERVQFLQLDLGNLTSVKKFSEDFHSLNLPALDILINNAGIMKSPGAKFIGQNLTYGYSTTVDGFESHIGINHIGHFYLTHLLLDKLKMASTTTPGGGGGARVIQVASSAEESAYDTIGFRFDEWHPGKNKNDDDGRPKMPIHYEDGNAYGQSKLANILFAKELATRMANSNVTAYSCHPGVIQTELFKDLAAKGEEDKIKMNVFERRITEFFNKLFGLALMTPKQGALTQLYLATTTTTTATTSGDGKDDGRGVGVGLVNGGFYTPVGRLEQPKHPAYHNIDGISTKVWDETIKALQAINIEI